METCSDKRRTIVRRAIPVRPDYDNCSGYLFRTIRMVFKFAWWRTPNNTANMSIVLAHVERTGSNTCDTCRACPSRTFLRLGAQCDRYDFVDPRKDPRGDVAVSCVALGMARLTIGILDSRYDLVSRLPRSEKLLSLSLIITLFSI